jgi:hypothetical protein
MKSDLGVVLFAILGMFDGGFQHGRGGGRNGRFEALRVPERSGESPIMNTRRTRSARPGALTECC